MTERSEQKPKPYDFVPFAEPVRRKTVGHERLRGENYNTGRLGYQIEVLSPLFISGGSYILGNENQAPLARDFHRVAGRPTIPGSSLKGVTRSVVEAISPSCVTTTRLDLDLIPYSPEQGEKGCTPAQACPACSMFGRMSRMAKITFTDAGLVRGKLRLYRLPALFSPRTQQGEQIYQEGGQYKGRKFYYHGRPSEDEGQPPVEVAPPRSLFEGQIHFENLSDAELGLMLTALGLDTTFSLKMGGGKPVCLGSILVKPGSLQLSGPDNFLQAEPVTQSLTGEAMVEVMIQKIRVAIRRKLILRDQLEKLREIWRYPNDRECPGGIY